MNNSSLTPHPLNVKGSADINEIVGKRIRIGIIEISSNKDLLIK